MQAASLPPGANLLDMGAGWGLSSEFFATLGCDVTSVDINPAFIELINKRQERHGMPITAKHGAFDTFVPSNDFDAVFFYECLHHAMRPWELMSRLRRSLKPGGKFLFAGEPVYDGWRSWGIRLDAISVYCVRKFGWLETGWSKSFISNCLVRAGFLPQIDMISLPEVGYICVARRIDANSNYSPRQLSGLIEASEWFVSDDFLASIGNSLIRLPRTDSLRKLTLHLTNFRQRPLNFAVHSASGTVHESRLPTGPSKIIVSMPNDFGDIRLMAETWRPDQEIGNGDQRNLSFHLSSISFHE
jgi:SAM-dependent methyltransferase